VVQLRAVQRLQVAHELLDGRAHAIGRRAAAMLTAVVDRVAHRTGDGHQRVATQHP
jgi:hypothetical protein